VNQANPIYLLTWPISLKTTCNHVRVARPVRGTPDSERAVDTWRQARHGGKVAAMSEQNPDPQVVPYLLYADAGAAMDWLIKVFGFIERVRDARSDGTVRHAELLTGDGGVIMLGSPGADFRGPAKLGEVTQLVCVTIPDLPGHRDRAQAAGATVSEVGTRAGRARSYTVDDPEGHRWYFSEPL
jgi:uncharacterized glyoxalase superfamily protein PhnB